MKSDFGDLPNIQPDLIDVPSADSVFAAQPSMHSPRILLSYGSVRQRSFSQLVVQESARILRGRGSGLSFFMSAPAYLGVHAERSSQPAP